MATYFRISIGSHFFDTTSSQVYTEGVRVFSSVLTRIIVITTIFIHYYFVFNSLRVLIKTLLTPSLSLSLSPCTPHTIHVLREQNLNESQEHPHQHNNEMNLPLYSARFSKSFLFIWQHDRCKLPRNHTHKKEQGASEFVTRARRCCWRWMRIYNFWLLRHNDVIKNEQAHETTDGSHASDL